MSDANVYMQWCIDTCNADNVGYSQSYRRGQTVNGITYYDCSSFVSAGLTAGGYFTKNPWFTTRTMGTYLSQIGCTKLDAGVPWVRGDIMWREGHTEVVYDPVKHITMGAHTSKVPLASQVSISSHSSEGDWTYLYRLPDTPAASAVWHYVETSEYGALTDDQIKDNATAFTMYFTNRGFTIESICGMLGNIQAESGLNPGQHQKGGSGLGLIQWTPSTILTDWCDKWGLTWYDGDTQCRRIDSEGKKIEGAGGYWLNGRGEDGVYYKYRWDDFSALTNVQTALYAYEAQRERAKSPDMATRLQYAMQWYDYFTSNPVSPFGNVPVWLFGAINCLKRNKKSG